MKTEELFPPCTKTNRPDCEIIGPHRHVLPQQQELLDSHERFTALVGGYGSGKTLPLCIMGHLLSISIPGNMGIIVRRSLPKLHDSTERIFLEVLDRSGVDVRFREMRDGWPHRVIYPNGSEVYFRETKDLGRFLGPEYGWFYIDEAQEEPEKTFTDLVGRLRLPRASKYLRGFIATNPPSNQHWIAKNWPKPGSWTKEVTLPNGQRVTTSWRLIRSLTYDNPFLRPDYVASLLQQNTASEARRIIEGQYGFVQEGQPVYPTFDFFKHVGDPPNRMMTLYRVWDFGFHSPAVAFSQIFRCKKNGIHIVFLHEIIGKDIETEALAAQVMRETRSIFKDIPSHLVIDGGDAAGAQINEKGPGPIIRLAKAPPEGYNLRFHYRKFPDLDPGLDLTRKLLRTKCQCGYHLFMTHRRNQTMIEALAGGYHYPKERAGHEKGVKPVKDGFYDNIADAVRYTHELFYRPIMNGLIDVQDALVEATGYGEIEQNRWDWMERIG